MEIFNQVTENTTIITPNRRLSATLIKHFNALQLTHNKTSWASLDALPLTSWLQRLWSRYCATHIEITPLLLTPQQEQILWEEILRQFPTNEALLQLSATADLAKSAWGMLKQWRVPLTHPLLDLTEDSHTFKQWAQQFVNICAQKNAFDSNTLIDHLVEKITQGQISLPVKIILTGFTEYTPQQKHLFSICETVGTEIVYFTPTSQNQTLERWSFPDEEAELLNMAAWAKSLHDHYPTARIGCIIPQLEKKRDAIIRVFTTIFSNPQQLITDYTTLPFNISAGKTLASYPIIYTALQLLGLLDQALSTDKLSLLLHTPFIGDADNEHIKRAQYDSYLRQYNATLQTLEQLVSSQEKHTLFKYCPLLAKRLQNFIDYYRTIPQPLAASTWVKHFVKLLTILGWPGERSLNSHEYQVVQSWLDLLNQYQMVEPVLDPLHYQNALHYLHRLANSAIFQVQSPEAPVQILGLLEAADIPFDYAWVMGLDDTTWPPPAKPNPFIPLRLQKTLHMPHASAEKELTYSTQLTQQLMRPTVHCLFSHAEKNAESELRPSSLITHIEVTTRRPAVCPQDPVDESATEAKIAPSAMKIIFHSQQQETLIDGKARVILAEEPIRGGVKIFKQQGACPFQAFAEIRLHAKPLEPLKLGLRPQDRGNIIHQALELVWKKLNNSAYLNQLADDELHQLITECATQAIEKVTGKKIEKLRYLTLELQRVHTLILNWLNYEKTRPAFSVISQEAECNMTIGNIPLTMRVDRIDELTDGKRLIIDYKTGKENFIQHWFSERPDEPQLPLYCLIDPEKTIGIAFAEIYPNKLTLKGISKNDIDIAAITPIFKSSQAENRSWEQQLESWQQIMNKLGHDFQQGIAHIDPKEEQTCQYCQLKSFCRLYEKN